MSLNPVFESQASDEVKESYSKIKDSLNLPTLPLFFSFLGSFPEYLKYLSFQIVPLAKNNRFDDICFETSLKLDRKINDILIPSEELSQWLLRYKNLPSFYNFQKDLQHIFLNNIKLAFIFISLREAVKGWAVGAKKLPSGATVFTQNTERIKEDFIFDDFYVKNNGKTTVFSAGGKSETALSAGSTAIIKQDKNYIEKDLLPEYLMLCRSDFTDILKKIEFLQLRIDAERDMLNMLSNLPNIIFSPINVVLQHTAKYSNFPDLLYLLSEHFPTYSIQRMLFSGYMIK